MKAVELLKAVTELSRIDSQAEVFVDPSESEMVADIRDNSFGSYPDHVVIDTYPGCVMEKSGWSRPMMVQTIATDATLCDRRFRVRMKMARAVLEGPLPYSRLRSDRETLRLLAVQARKSWEEWISSSDHFPTTTFLDDVDELIVACGGPKGS